MTAAGANPNSAHLLDRPRSAFVRLSRPLRWLLLATLSLSAWAWWYPVPTPPVVAASVRASASAAGAEGATALSGPSMSKSSRRFIGIERTGAAMRWPSKWPSPNLDAPMRDPFASSEKAASVPVGVRVEAPQPPVKTSPPRQEMKWRVWGSVTDPEGSMSLYLSRAEDKVPVLVTTGALIGEGWTIDSIANDSVVLGHAESGQRVVLPLHVN